MSRIFVMSTVVGALLAISPGVQAVSFQTVSQTAAGAVNGAIDVTPQCPDGSSPIGGGWRAGDPSSQYVLNSQVMNTIHSFWAATPRFALVGSYPNGNGWRTFGFTNGDVIVEIYTVCASG